MASIVTLKSDGLSEAAAKAAALKTDMDSIYAQLNKLEIRLGENISALQSSAQTSQNFGFSSQKKGLSAQTARMNSVVTLLNTACSEAGNSTNKLTNGSRQLQLSVSTLSASGTVSQAVGVTASSLAISSVFGGDWVSNIWTSLTDWLTRVGKGVAEKVEEIRKETQRIEHKNDAVSSKLKSYENSSKNWSPSYGGKANDYSNYSVINGFNEDHVLNQHDYTHPDLACTATSDAIVASILNGEKIAPDKTRWKESNGKYSYDWQYTEKLPGSTEMTVEEQCQTIYDYVQAGTPVVMRVSGHSVVAIGLRNNVDRSKITPADILVVDPGQAKVKTAAEIYSRWYKDSKNSQNLKMVAGGEGYGLRVPVK